MQRIYIIMVLLVTIDIAQAQLPETGAWFAVNLPVNFTTHWQWHHDAGYRTLGTSVEPLQYFYRTGVRYNLNKKWSTSGGIAFFFTKTNFRKSEHEFGHEFRFWEELNHQHPVNEKHQWLLRFRAEQRFFAATSVNDKYTGYRFRLRPGFTQRLNNKWSLQITDEYMQQAAGHEFSFNQNRLTFSGIYQFNNTTQLQAGYMWLKWPKDNQHILTFTFTKNISLHGE